MDAPAQAAVVLAIWASLAAATVATCSLADLSFAGGLSGPIVMGLIFVAAGVSHFTLKDEFNTMMPHQGAWGFWYLPGSDDFHVAWTGVAEVAGGAALLASALPPVQEQLPGLQPAAALSLFALVAVVTPSNTYMFTHNAPGPGPKGTVIPPAGHAARWVMQVVLLSVLWGVAHPVA